jgi:hypothetical protein
MEGKGRKLTYATRKGVSFLAVVPILDLTLTDTGYSGRFVPAQGFGNLRDSFSGGCTNYR